MRAELDSVSMDRDSLQIVRLSRGDAVDRVGDGGGVGRCSRRKSDSGDGDGDADRTKAKPEIPSVEGRIEHGGSGRPFTDKSRAPSDESGDE